MDTKELRNQAGALLDQAQTAIEQGELDTFQRLADEAHATMEKADQIDAAASQVRKLRGEFNQPLNAIPVTSNDVAIYNAMDTTARIKNDYKPTYPYIDKYLQKIGRMKLTVPLYRAMAGTDAGRERARAIYAQARPGYHPIAQATIAKLLANKNCPTERPATTQKPAPGSAR